MSRKKTKSQHMTDETFAELMKSAKQALAYERGEDSGHRVTRIAVPRPPRPMSSADIARIRQQLKYSQSVFARVLNVSPKTVQAWEQGIRVPSDAALKLLTLPSDILKCYWKRECAWTRESVGSDRHLATSQSAITPGATTELVEH